MHSEIFVPKITGIGQLRLKLLLVVGWYTCTFLRHSVHCSAEHSSIVM